MSLVYSTEECAPKAEVTGGPTGVAGVAEAAAGGGWSVTLCGGARTALPRDVEMRLRFPTPPPPLPPRAAPTSTACACRPSLPPPPAPALALRASPAPSAPRRTASESLPELSYRASRTRTKRSVKVHSDYQTVYHLPLFID